MLPRWDAEAFAGQLKGRRLIIVGDTLQRQFFLSLACLLAEESVSGKLVNWADSGLPMNGTYEARCACLAVCCSWHHCCQLLPSATSQTARPRGSGHALPLFSNLIYRW